MKGATIEGVLDYYEKATNNLIGMTLAIQGKTIENVSFEDLGKLVREQNVSKERMKKKINQLRKKRASEIGQDHEETRAKRTCEDLQG